MWSLEKWYRWTKFQGRSTDRDNQNKHMDTNGEEEGGMDSEMGIDTYTLLMLLFGR